MATLIMHTGITQGSETTKMADLIMDMGLGSASMEELVRAITHSMAAIQFDKSARENGIDELIEKYQLIEHQD